MSDPSTYDRCDAGVLYLDEADLLRSMPLLDVVLGCGSRWPRPANPYFTDELAPGMGLAEDPCVGSSFGVDRCRKLAAGLLPARHAAGGVEPN